MANVLTDSKSNLRILFVNPTGTRHSLNLGKTTKRNAEQLKLQVERLIEMTRTGEQMDDNTARWLGEMEDQLFRKLVTARLVPHYSQNALASMQTPFEDFRHKFVM